MKLIFISGPSGSGKTTLSNQIIKKNNHECYVANDNSPQQVVISGFKKNLQLLSQDLNKLSIKNIKL